MIFKEITLKGLEYDKLSTEIMYEIATARADRAELVRVNIPNEEIPGKQFYKKPFALAIKILKTMKADGRIQFFATAKSFENSSTEAVFLQNKYADIFIDVPVDTQEASCIYIKI